MTESAFFASKSMRDCMEEFDVEEYQFVATLDMRTSTICRDMDKKVFKMKDFAPGTTAPPLHCHCRSHISPYFADAAVSERVARGQDGKTYMIPSNMNYRDWERVYVKKEISLEDWKKSLNKKENDVIISVDKPVEPTKIVYGHASIPLRTLPNQIIDYIAENNKVDNRVFYDNEGKVYKQVNPTNHGNPKNHKYGKHGEHAHDFLWKSGKVAKRTTRELTDLERKENSDIL